MKNIIISLFVVSLISGCKTTPSTPKPNKDKYTFQCLYITIPGDSLEDSFSLKGNQATLSKTQSQLDDILSHPDAEVIELPIVIAGIGESVTNDQTKAVLLPEDYDIVDGKAVAKNTIIHIGKSFSVTPIKVENGIVISKILPSWTKLKGYDEYKIEDDISVKMPMFERKVVDSVLSLELNAWTLLGGLVDQSSDGTSVNNLVCFRVLPPTTDK